MIVICPACRTRYQVDQQALRRPGGRTVRCAGCGNVWQEAPPPIEAAGSPAAATIDPPRIEPPLEIAPRLSAAARPPSRRRPRSWGAFGLIVLIFLLVVVVLAGIFARGAIVAMWPATASFYALVGLPDR